jgi:hypothetical protein
MPSSAERRAPDLMVAEMRVAYPCYKQRTQGDHAVLLDGRLYPQALNAMRKNLNINRQAAVEQLLSVARGQACRDVRATNGPGVMMIFDVTDPAMAPAITVVAVSAGTIQNVQMTRLFTRDEVKGIRQKVGQNRGAYGPPGQQ